MRKIIFVPAVVALLFAGVVSAQTYTYPSNYTYSSYGSSSTGCLALTSDLSYGARGSEVSRLQQFLVSQNYPGGGSWMVTGYFGAATVQAVRNFQITAGLPSSGFVDAQTRSAIQSRTCGTGNVSYLPPATYQSTPTYTYPTYPTYPNNPTYPTYPTYPVTNPPTVSSLSIYTGVSGSVVTVYGSNFDAYSNTVRFGPSSVIASSQTGSQLTFVVPAVSPASYQVSVANARGTSNSMTFTVTAGANIPGCVLGAGNTCCSQWSYNQACGQLTLTYLNPISGAVGSAVTIHGTGFSPTGNTIHFGQGIIANVGSFDGQSVSFTVPSVLYGFGSSQVQIGSYPIYVTNAFGQNSNVLSYNVTSTSGTPTNAPAITSVNGPTSLSVGAQGTWTLNLNTYGGTYMTVSVRWGDENVYPYAAAAQTLLVQGGPTVTFTHSYQTAGTYTVTFTVSNTAGSNTATSTVQVGGGGGGSAQLSLSTLSPNSGRVGSQITIQGTGFTSSNDVHFGVGGMRNVASSNNGTTISFIIPAWVSPCDLISSGYVCGAPVTQVTPGQYPLYVTNTTGATNVLYFTVIQ